MNDKIFKCFEDLSTEYVVLWDKLEHLGYTEIDF